MIDLGYETSETQVAKAPASMSLNMQPQFMIFDHARPTSVRTYQQSSRTTRLHIVHYPCRERRTLRSTFSLTH
jgi:hypothetical protein